MSNIIVSPSGGLIEFNTGVAGGDTFFPSTAPIRLDATGGNSWITGSNVGIGTDAPTKLLEVDGYMVADRYYAGLYNWFTSTSHHALIHCGATSYGLGVYCHSADLNINTSDNAGLGFSNGHSANYNTVDARFFRHSAGVIGLGTTFGSAANGTLTVGDVGIGTTAPLALLDVRGDISGSGDFLGTGVGNRITSNGTPYLLSGDSPAETQTLQQVTDRGSTTTNAISITTESPSYISGNTASLSPPELLTIANGGLQIYNKYGGVAPLTGALNSALTIKGMTTQSILTAGNICIAKWGGKFGVESGSFGEGGNPQYYIGMYGNSNHKWYYYGDLNFYSSADGYGVDPDVTFASDGNVGIGTDNPAYPLHVVGAGRPAVFESSNGSNITKFGNSTCGVATYNGLDINVNSTNSCGLQTYGMPMTFWTSTGNGVQGAERLRIDNDGNVGIGTTVPSGFLHVDTQDAATGTTNYGIVSYLKGGSNSTNIAGYFSAREASNNYALQTVDGKVDFGGNITAAGTIDARTAHSSTLGNIFVGDITSSYAAGNGGDIVFAGDGLGQGTANAVFANIRGIKENSSYGNSLGALVFGTQTGVPDSQTLATVTEKMRITSDGYVGIGTGDPNNMLEVYKAADPKIILSDANTFKIALTTDGTNGTIESLNAAYATHVTPISFDLNTAALTTQALNVTSATSTTVLTMGNNSHRIYSEPNDFAIVQTTSSHKAFRLLGNVPADTLVLKSDGNVGIGTDAPSELLHVSGGILLAEKNDAAETWHNIIVADNSASGVNTLAGIGFNAQGWTNDIAKAGIFQKREGSYGRGSLYFVNNNDSSWTSATESDAAITIDPDGNVGIGTDDPGEMLEIGTGGRIGLTDSAGTYDSTIYVDGSTFTVTTGDGSYHADKVNILDLLNLGAGHSIRGVDSSIIANKDILAPKAGSFGFRTYGETNQYDAISSIFIDNNNNALAINTKAGGTTAEAVRIDKDGKLGIGTGVPISKLHVAGGTSNFSTSDFDTAASAGGSLEIQPFTNYIALKPFKNGSAAWGDIVFPYGSVGIGTSVPDAKLHISGSDASSSTNSLLVQNSAGVDMLWVDNGKNVNARDNLYVHHGTVSSRKLRLWWGGVAAYDGANELSLMSDYDDGGSNRIMICGPTADNFPSDTIQLQANNGLSIYSGASPFPPEYHLHVSGDVGGTGIGDRITLNGTGYLLSGDSPAETQTLQQVTDRGSTTTNAITSSGPHISGVTGLFSDKVGIGTSAPAYPLEVNGRSKLGTMGLEGGFLINYSSFSETQGGAATLVGNAVYAGNTVNTFRRTKADVGNYMLMTYSKGITFHTNVTGNTSDDYPIGDHEQMRLTLDGKVGIGTASPNALLEINDNIPRFSLYDTATSKRWEINKQYGGLNFAEIGAADMRLFLKDGGDVGIGVDPSYALDVSSSTTDQVARFKSTDADAFISIEDNYDSVYIGHSSGDNVMSLGFNTPMGSTSNLTINPLGNVGIGTNVPDSSVPLTILGPSAGRFMTLDAPTDGAYMTFETATTAYADIGSEKAITAAGAVDDLLINVRGSREILFKTNSTERLRIDSAGFVGVGTGNPLATLDVDGTMRIHSSSTANDWVQWQGIHSDGRMKLRDNNDYNVIQLQTASNIQCFGEGQGSGHYGLSDWAFMAYQGYATAAGLNIGSNNGTAGTHKSIGISTPQCRAANAVSLPTDNYIEFNTYAISGNTYPAVDIRPAIRMAASGYEFYADTATHGFPDDPHFSINPAGYSYFTGKVGIGTTSPSELLHLQDSSLSPQIRIDGGDGSSDGNAILGLYEQRNGQFGFKFKYDGSNNRLDILSRVSDVDTARLTIDRSLGNVGIGTTAPAYLLDVSGEARVTSNLRIGNYGLISENSQLLINQSAYYPIVFKTNNTERMRVAADGNVGIGTAIPNGALHLHSALTRTLLFTNPTIGAASSDGTYMGTSATTVNFRIVNQEAGKITFGTNNTHRFDIDSNGRVGIGLPSSDSDLALATLDVRGDISGSGDFLGTGVGNRITNNGTPYLLSGDAASALTLQNVCDNGSTTTTSVTISDDLIVDTDTLFVDASTDRVGIGTSAPDAMLHISGGSALIQGISKSYAKFYHSVSASDYVSTSANVLALTDYYATKEYGIYVNNAGNFSIAKSGSANALVIDDNNITVTGYNLKFASTQSQASPAINLRGAENGDEVGIYSPATNKFSIVTDRTDRVVVDAVGSVGIGTTAPNGALHVNVENTRQLLFTRSATGPSATDGTYMGQGSTDFSIINQEAGNLYLGTSNTNRLTIEAGGDVGIGTTAPNATFEVNSTSSASTAGQVRITNDNNTIGDKTIVNNSFWGTAIFAPVGYGAVATAVGAGGSRKADFVVYVADDDNWVDGDERLRITSDGNVGIGTGDPAYKLDVKQDSETYAARIFNDGNDQNRDVLLLQGGLDAYLGNTKFITFADGNGTETAWIQGATNNTSGGLAINTTAANATDFVVDESGNVGIGTNAPDAMLHIDDGACHIYKNATIGTIAAPNKDNAALHIEDSSYDMYVDGNSILGTNATWISTSGNYSLSLGTNNTERVTILGAGNVGIGTTNPSSLLEVKGSDPKFILKSSDATDAIIKIDAGLAKDSYLAFAQNGSSKWAVIHDYVGTDKLSIYNYANNDNMMVFLPNGNVGIGSNTPVSQLNIQPATGSITFGGLNVKGANLDTSIGLTDVAGDHVGTYHEQTSVLTTNGSPSMRGFWANHRNGYAENGVTWSGPSLIGFYAEQHISTTSHRGTISNQYGFRASAGINSCGVGGTVTNAYGVYIELLNNDSDGTVTNSYGVYINDTDTAGASTNRWGIYSEGSATKNYFQGSVGIGTNSNHASSKLDVIGAIKAQEIGNRGGNFWIGGDSNGTNGNGLTINYFDGSAWNEALEVNNTAGGAEGDLLLMQGGGSVGIGTATPNAAYKLHVHGLAYATGAVIGNSYAGQSPPSNGLVVEGNVGIGYYAATNKLGVYGNANVGSSYQSIAAPSNGLIVEGDVGIGNSAPQAELDVSGAIKGGFSLSAKSADFTLGVGDNGGFINGTSASFDQITISSDLGADFNVAVMNTGANVVITGSSSMIINGTVDGGVTLASGYQPASIVRLATNTYAVFGNLS